MNTKLLVYRYILKHLQLTFNRSYSTLQIFIIMELNGNDIRYLQLREVLSKLKPLELYSNYSSGLNELQTQEDVIKLCESLLKCLKGDLSLEEISSLYSASVMLLLLEDPEILNLRLDLINDCFNYSDMLKPTMIDYTTRELLNNFKFAARLAGNHTDYDYISNLLTAIPHIIAASETGKIISLGLLRAFIAELSLLPQSAMHIYRNISEIWQMIKTINMETILDEWPAKKIYILIKSFSLILATAALNSNNMTLSLGGYRGFELPPADTENEISECFKTLRNNLKKLKIGDEKSSLMLVRLIDFNILSFLSESGNEATSEGGTEPAA